MKRRLGVALIAAALVLVAALVAAVVWRDDTTPLDAARSLAADRSGFDTGLEAGLTLGRVAAHLEDSVRDCRRATDGTRCAARSAALGYTQVLAAVVIRCTAPGRHEARTRLVRYLDEVADVAPRARALPRPPRLPACGP